MQSGWQVETMNKQFTDKVKTNMTCIQKKVFLLVIEGKHIKIELSFLSLTFIKIYTVPNIPY